MDPVKYVNEASLQRAQSMEKKFQYCKPDAGILFISVKAVPEANGLSKTFEVRLGVTKLIGEPTGKALVRWVLHEEIDQGYIVLANVYQGVPGAARGNTGDEEAGALPH